MYTKKIGPNIFLFKNIYSLYFHFTVNNCQQPEHCDQDTYTWFNMSYLGYMMDMQSCT